MADSSAAASEPDFAALLMDEAELERLLSVASEVDRGGILNEAGQQRCFEFDQTHQPEHLERAVAYYERSVKILATNPPQAAVPQFGLAGAYLKRFKAFNDPSDLDAAIGLYESILDISDCAAYLHCQCLSNLCIAVRRRRTGGDGDSTSYSQQAVEYGTRALTLLQENHPFRSIVLLNLSIAFIEAPSLEDFDMGVSIGKQALDLLQDKDPPHFVKLASRLGLALMLRSMDPNLLSNENSLDDSIDMYRRALEQSSNSTDPTRQQLLRRLSGVLYQRFKQSLAAQDSQLFSACLHDLDAARENLTLSLETDGQFSEYHYAFGCLWQQRFLLTEELGDINKAVLSFQTALTKSGSHNRGKVLHGLATALTYKFCRERRQEHLDYAIELLQKASRLLKADHSQYSSCVANLCAIALLRYLLRYSSDDLDLVIKKGEPVAEFLSGALRGRLLTTLCSAYLQRSNRKRSLSGNTWIRTPRDLAATRDLHTAIEKGELAVQLLPAGECRAHGEAVLAEAFNALHITTQEGDSTGNIVSVMEFQNQMSSGGKSRLVLDGYDYLTGADGELTDRWREIFGMCGHIGIEVSAIPSAAELPPWLEDYQNKLIVGGMTRSHPASRPRRSLPHTLRLADIDISATLLMEAIQEYMEKRAKQIKFFLDIQEPDITHLGSSTCLQTLTSYRLNHTGTHCFAIAMLIKDRYELTRDPVNLDFAINMFEKASSPGAADPNYPLVLRHWGEVLHSRFEERELNRGKSNGEIDFTDINNAITMIDKGVEALPSHGEAFIRADYLKALSDALIGRFEVSLWPDIFGSEALAWMQKTEWDVSMQNYLGYGMEIPRYKDDKEKARKDICRAIDLLQQAAQLVGSDAELAPSYSLHLARALRRRHRLTKSNDDIKEAIRLLELAATATAAPLTCRVQAADEGVGLLLESGNKIGASTLASHGIELLRRLASRPQTPGDGKKMLSFFRGMTACAVSLSVAYQEDPFLAIRNFEIGRGILSGDFQRQVAKIGGHTHTVGA